MATLSDGPVVTWPIMCFPDAATRDAALSGQALTGFTVFLEDIDAILVHDGNEWVVRWQGG